MAEMLTQRCQLASRSQTPLGRQHCGPRMAQTGPSLPQASPSFVPVALQCPRASSPFLPCKQRSLSIGWRREDASPQWPSMHHMPAKVEYRTLSVGRHCDPFALGGQTRAGTPVRRPPLPQAPVVPFACGQPFQAAPAPPFSRPCVEATLMPQLSPHLVTRGSLPPALLRGQIAMATPTSASTMSTPNLARPEQGHACVRSRSYTPDPLVPWPVQSTPRAQVCIAPPALVSRCAAGPAPGRCASSPPNVAQARPSPAAVSPRRVFPCGEVQRASAASFRPPQTPPGPSARAQEEDTELPKCAAGIEVSVGGTRYRCRSVLGRGSFSEVWSGEVVGSPSKEEVALKDIFCKTKADLEQALFEVSLLERFKDASSSGKVSAMRIPRYYGHKVDQKENGWRVCLAMARMPGECLDSWLKRPPPPNQDGPSSVRRGCALAMALIRQLGPTLERIAPHAWHRDVNSHNVLLSDGVDGGRLMPCADVEETSRRACFWLIDFGLAVEASTWPQKWPHSDVAGDCRYWAASSFVMSFCGPEETASQKELCAQYRTKLDIVGLGLTALEMLCGSALASRDSWGPDGLRGSWERLLETWERYREDVTRWHTMIFQVFAKGGDIAPLYRQLGQERIVERVVVHLADVRTCLRACVKRTEDLAIQRLLTVLAEMVDEKTGYDMRKVLEHLDPPKLHEKVLSPATDLGAKIQWWHHTRIPHVGGA